MKKVVTLVATAVFVSVLVLMPSLTVAQEKKAGPQTSEPRALKSAAQAAAPASKKQGYTVTGRLTEGLAGGTVGEYTYQLKMGQTETNKEYDYSGKKGKEINIESTKTARSVTAGGTIELGVTYILLTPTQESVKLTEVREIYYGATLCGNLQVKVERKGGKHQSAVKITIPQNTTKGIYTVRYIVESAFSKDSRDAIFTVE
jgi:hypothetical protein